MTDVVGTFLELDALEVDCIIGDLPEERLREQRLVVDISLGICPKAFFSDDIGDTVDYVALADLVRARLVEAKCRMIERAAMVAAEACMVEALVSEVRVKVTKPGIIEHLASASAVACLRRR